MDRSLALTPDDALALGYKVSLLQNMGRLEEAGRTLDAIPASAVDPGVAFYRAYQRLLERRFDVAISELGPMLARPEPELNGLGGQLRW